MDSVAVVVCDRERLPDAVLEKLVPRVAENEVDAVDVSVLDLVGKEIEVVEEPLRDKLWELESVNVGPVGDTVAAEVREAVKVVVDVAERVSVVLPVTRSDTEADGEGVQLTV